MNKSEAVKHWEAIDEQSMRASYESQKAAGRFRRRVIRDKMIDDFQAIMKKQIVIELSPAPVWSLLIALAIFGGILGTIYNYGVEQGQLSALKSAYDIVRKNSKGE